MISVIIPVYKNRNLFLNNLRNNLKYLKDCEIIIVNDDPKDSLKNDLKEVSSIILLENNKNLGFAQTVNKGVQKTNNNFIMLLNSDVRLLDNSFKEAIKFFNNDNSLFAISFAQEEKDKTIVGKNIIYWKNGFIMHQKNTDLSSGLNAWAEAGACIIDRKKYMDLGGFDPLYSPFYWEDIDLSYRAWKRGYNILFEPKIKVEHQHESTIGKYFNKDKIKTIAYRNQLIFIWKNITDNKLLFNHFVYLIPTLTKALIKGDFAFMKGFIAAIVKMNLILEKRKMEQKTFVKTDRQILMTGHCPVTTKTNI